MRFTNNQDFEVPVTYLFKRVSNFAEIERLGMRAGAQVLRTHGHNGQIEGTTWSIMGIFRGRKYDVDLLLHHFTPNERLEFSTHIRGFDVEIKVLCVELAKERSRLSTDVNLKPKSLSARILQQPLKLAKRSIHKRSTKGLKKLAHRIEADYKAT